MANVYYTVVKGDTLTRIANQYNTTIAKLVELNDIVDPDLILIGQRLLISGTKTPATVVQRKATIKELGLLANSESGRQLMAVWTFSNEKSLKGYHIQWEYYPAGSNVPLEGSYTKNESVKLEGTNKDSPIHEYSLWDPPSNATKVRIRVLGYAKSYNNGKVVESGGVAAWAGSWSSWKTFNIDQIPPTPSIPSIDIDGTALKVTIDDYVVENPELYPGIIELEIELIKNNTTSGRKVAAVKPVTGYAEYTWTITSGQTQYKARARARYYDSSKRKTIYSDWSGYSGNKTVLPNTPKQITECRAMSEDSVYLKWSKATGAKGYEVQYTDVKSRFDTSNQDVNSESYDATIDHAEIAGLESGKEYFFRVRATNDGGVSGWTPIKSTKVGSQPGVPTTWSSTTTAITGEPLSLYWVHNAEDGSSQTYANLELVINGVKQTINIKNTTDEDEKDKTSVYQVDTSTYVEGTQIKWRVQTRGVLAEYSDWSAQRTIDIYAPPTLEVTAKDLNGDPLTVLRSFPFSIECKAGPDTQNAIGYHILITNDYDYTTVDEYGNLKMVPANSTVYSRFYEYSMENNTFVDEISAYNVSLENGVAYTIRCTVAMDSGLSAESLPITFTTEWDDFEFYPSVEIAYDPDTVTTEIRPYCTDFEGNLVDGVMMSVYRRSYDGELIEIGSNMPNIQEEWVTDPHPSLDLARYRIIATEESTGRTTFYDAPGQVIGETAAIIQWEEAWSEFEYADGRSFEPKAWSGSMIKLPYNIDVSESNSPDVELISYIGRKHPVAYYGTQIGESGSWSMDIPKDDVETLYALRRLRSWMGNVYVREPSGVGYWATVTVSYSQTHKELTIPVTLNITRVEGGL